MSNRRLVSVRKLKFGQSCVDFYFGRHRERRSLSDMFAALEKNYLHEMSELPPVSILPAAVAFANSGSDGFSVVDGNRRLFVLRAFCELKRLDLTIECEDATKSIGMSRALKRITNTNEGLYVRLVGGPVPPWAINLKILNQSEFSDI